MQATESLTWADAAAVCRDCHRPFRISEEAITAQLAENAGDRAAAIHSIDFCLGCVQGESPAGEYDVVAYYGWTWSEQRKEWVIVLAWKCGPRPTWPVVRSQQRPTGMTFPRNKTKACQDWVAARNREIAAAIGEA
jgi:hypothetical protein